MRFKRLLGFGLSLSIVFPILPLQVVADEISDQIKCRSLEGEEYSVQENITSTWDGHSNVELVFTNTGDETINDWYYTFDFGYEIENPYNCYILEHEGNLYTIGNNDWNQDIKPGESVTIGFTAASADGSAVEAMPSFYLLNTKTIELPADAVSLEYTEYSNWTDGFSGALTLNNNTDIAIRDWSITFSANRPITESYGSILTVNDDGTYMITNDGNSQNITTYGSFQIGFNGGNNDPAIPFEISDLSVTAHTYGLSLSEDNDDNGVPDVCEADYSGTIVVTPTPTPTNTPTVTEIPTITDEPIPTTTDAPTATPTVEIPTDCPTATPTAVPTETIIPDDIDYYTDTDGDLIPDDLEPYYGTDKDNPDTDCDGIPDGYELFAGLNPIEPDSDNNGILDGDEDCDGDGLSNYEEVIAGSNIMNPDSDLDGLTDYEEVIVYGTSPVDYDTDDDGINDYDEIHMGLNPLLADSDNDGIPDNEERLLQSLTVELTDDNHPSGVFSVTVEAEISGCISANTTINDCYFDGCVCSLIDGPVGVPVDITTTGCFEDATIIFNYDESKLGDAQEANLAICWIDYDNGQIVPLECVVDEDNNSVTATTNHFSQYVLIDMQAYFDMWCSNIEQAIENQNSAVQNYDFVVACQLSENTTMEERNQEWRAIYQLIMDLKPGDRMTVFAFGGGTILDASGYIAYGDDFNSKIQLINRSVYDWDDGSGKSLGTIAEMYAAIRGAALLYNYCFSDDLNERQFILFTNGESTSLSDEGMLYAEAYGFDINVIMVGDKPVSSMASLYQPFNGASIQVSDVDTSVLEVPNVLYDYLDDSDEDADGDGLLNKVEDYPILTSYGFFVNTDRDVADTDGDSLKDGQELTNCIKVMTHIGYFDKYDLYYHGYNYDEFMDNYGGELTMDLSCYVIESRPDMKDTDLDFYSDATDSDVWNPSVLLIGLGSEKYQPITNQNDEYEVIPSSKYTQIENYPGSSNGDKSYGGNQGWVSSYNDTVYASSSDLTKEYLNYITNNGCGITATTDLVLYLYNGKETYDYYDSYRDFYLSVGNEYLVLTPGGIVCYSIPTALNSIYFEITGYPFLSSWNVASDFPKPFLIDVYESMLENNNPVILNVCSLSGNSSAGIAFYELKVIESMNPSEEVFVQLGDSSVFLISNEYNYSIDGHYFTATGIITDNNTGNIYIRISSWGKEYYISYDEYYEFLTDYPLLEIKNGFLYYE